jgi:hypothetical protein
MTISKTVTLSWNTISDLIADHLEATRPDIVPEGQYISVIDTGEEEEAVLEFDIELEGLPDPDAFANVIPFEAVVRR